MKLRLATVFIILFFLEGCAVNKLHVPPPDKATLSLPISIKISDQGLSKMALPTGVYQVSGTPLLVTGHQDDIGFLGAFGVLGVLVSNEINVSKGAEKVKTKENLLNIKIKGQVEETFKNLITTAPFSETFSMGTTQGNATLEITQNLLLNFVSDTEAIPFVVFKVDLNDSDNKTIWSMRYSSTTGIARPLTGEKGWLENNYESLLNSFNKSINQAVTVILNDIYSPFPRDENKKIIVQGSFPFCRAYVQLLGYHLSENEDNLIFMPLASLGGINILKKDTIYFRPAKSDDPIVSEQVKKLM